MLENNEYDLTVVGDQLAGFFLAAGAAQAGLKVLVIEGRSLVAATYDPSSGNILTDLFCEPLLGLSSGSKEDAFLRSLGLYQKIEELFPPFFPPLQLLTPEWRVDYTYSLPDLDRELSRELGRGSGTLAQLLAGHMVSKRDFVELVAEEKLPVSWEKFGPMQLALYSSMVPDRLPYSEYKRVVDLAGRGGVRYCIGGRSALKERLLDHIHAHGGHVKSNAWVEEIVFERGRFSGVLLSTYQGFVRSPIVVGAVGAKTFLSLVPKEMRPKRLVESLVKVEPRYWRMSFSIVLPEEIVPEGLGSHFAFLDPERDLKEDAFFQAQLLPADAYKGIPQGHRILVTRFLVPYEEKSIRPDNIQRLMRRILLHLEGFIPGIRARALSISPNPEQLERDPVFDKYFRFSSLAEVPHAFLVYQYPLPASPLNREFMDWSDLGTRGLLLCSRDMDPSLGLIGEIRSAMSLLENLQKKAKQSAKKR